jgi:hypothetical protein
MKYFFLKENSFFSCLDDLIYKNKEKRLKIGLFGILI